MNDTPTTGFFPVPSQLPRVLCAPSGWTLEAFYRLDEAAPGLLRFATSSRPVWRHAVAMTIANGLFDHADSFYEAATGERLDDEPWPAILSRVATHLMRMAPRAIIEASFGFCPDGLVGALRKLDFEPLIPEAFLALRAIFIDPASARRKVVIQLSRLDQELFEAACVLDFLALSPALVRRAKSGAGAERINRQIAAIRRHCSTATDEALRQSLSDFSADAPIESWSRSWLARADQNIPAPPWKGNEGLVPLTTGELLSVAATATRTCIRTRIYQVLEGRAAYYLDTELKAIACVIRTTSGWIATQVVASNNGFLPPAQRNRIFDILEANGISCFRPVRHGALDTGLIGRPHLGMGEFALDDHDLDDPLD